MKLIKFTIAICYSLALFSTYNFAQGLKGDEKRVIIRFNNNFNLDNNYHFTKTNWNRNDDMITLIDGEYEEKWALKNGTTPDEVVYSLKNDTIILRLNVNHLDYYEYLLTKEDTIAVTYEKENIVLSSSNVTWNKKYDYNFDRFVRSKQPITKYSALSETLNARMFYVRNLLSNNIEAGKSPKETNSIMINNINKIRAQRYENTIAYLTREMWILDSLKLLDEISVPQYSYYSQRNELLKGTIKVYSDNLSQGDINNLSQSYFNTNSRGNYLNLFLLSVRERWVNQADFLNIKDGTNRDYRQIFEMIDSSFLTRKAKEYLLNKELKNIHRAFSREEFTSYYKRFKESIVDTELNNFVKNEYQIEFDKERTAENGMFLKSETIEKLTFKELQEVHQGKIIYVDFWASWCAPCREAMPTSRQLREKLKDKNIVFIYLSLDENINAWKKASKKEELTQFDHSYLIINPKTSDFLKNNNITEIPRYMIFDKTGKLIYGHAPRVESDEIEKLLVRLAGQD